MARSALLLAVFALVSKALGVVRDALVARVFGAGDDYQAFVIASTLPTQLLNIFLGGAIVGAFVPQYQRRLAEADGEARAWQYFVGVALLLVGVGLGLALVLALTAPFVVERLGPGLTPAAQASASTLGRWLAASVPILVAATIVGALLNAHERFLAPGLRTPANNAGFIAALIVTAGRGSDALVFAFFAGALTQLAVQLPSLRRSAAGRGHVPELHRADLVEMLASYVPILATHALLQSIVLVDRPFSTLAVAGGGATYAYAERFVELSRAVLASSLAVVIFPRLAREPEGSPEAARLVGGALGLVALLTVPLGFLLGGWGRAIVALILEHGRFSAADTEQVAQALLGLAATPLTYGAIYIVDRQLIARRRLWAWAGAMGFGLALNVVLKLTLGARLGLFGVALATAVGTLATALLGLALVRLPRHALAGVGSSLAASLGAFGTGWWAVTRGPFTAASRGLGGAALMLGIGTMIVALLRPPAARQLVAAFARKRS